MWGSPIQDASVLGKSADMSGPIFIPNQGFDLASYPLVPYLTDPGYMLTATGDAGISPQALFDSKSTARAAPAHTYYQDPSRPDNSGDGLTLATAKQTLPSAIALGNASGAPFMIKTAGVENFRATGPAGTDVTQDCAIVPVSGRSLFGTHDSFTLPLKTDPTYTNLYWGTLGNVQRMTNRLVQNVDGCNVDYDIYSAVTHGSLANALAAANTSTGKDVLVIDSGGGKWYAIRADGAQPTPTNSRLYRSAVSLFKFRNNVNIYMENIDMEGSAPLDVDRTVQQTVAKVLVLNTCSGNYAGGVVDIGAKGLSVSNMKGLAYFFNCTAKANATDGINGHDPLASGLWLLIVNPVANDNGRRFDQAGATNQSCNGITWHDGCGGFVYGGQSLRNHGGSFRIVNAGKGLVSGLRSNDLGDVVFGGSITPTAFQNDNTSDIYYDRIKADVLPGELALVVSTGATGHIHNMHASPGIISGAGTILPF